MTIKIGDKLPNATFRLVTADGPKPVTTQEYFAGRKNRAVRPARRLHADLPQEPPARLPRRGGGDQGQGRRRDRDDLGQRPSRARRLGQGDRRGRPHRLPRRRRRRFRQGGGARLTTLRRAASACARAAIRRWSRTESSSSSTSRKRPARPTCRGRRIFWRRFRGPLRPFWAGRQVRLASASFQWARAIWRAIYKLLTFNECVTFAAPRPPFGQHTGDRAPRGPKEHDPLLRMFSLCSIVSKAYSGKHRLLANRVGATGDFRFRRPARLCQRPQIQNRPRRSAVAFSKQHRKGRARAQAFKSLRHHDARSDQGPSCLARRRRRRSPLSLGSKRAVA